MARLRQAKGKVKRVSRAARPRRGKSEAMTGKKEAEVEVRTAELDLQPIVIDRTDFKTHLRSIERATKMQKDAKNLYDGCCKAAKAVSDELLDAVKLHIKWADKDPDELRRQLEIQRFVLKETASPIQLILHDALFGDQNKLAEERGRRQGTKGQAMDDPYPESSDLSQIFRDAYTKAQSAMGIGMGTAASDNVAAADHNTRNGMPTDESASALN